MPKRAVSSPASDARAWAPASSAWAFETAQGDVTAGAVKSQGISGCGKRYMYGIFVYIWVIYRVNVGEYSIHGASGIYTYIYVYIYIYI